jgi:hypothetical protein
VKRSSNLIELTRRLIQSPRQRRSMPIRPYLDGQKFDPEAIRIMGLAFEMAPDMVVGEAKSLADVAIKQSDITQLKKVAERLPGVTVVISVMKEKFSEQEKRRLRRFVEWARRSDSLQGPSHSVILMTAVELFADHNIDSAWKKAGEPYKARATFQTFRTLRAFAEATQAIHLGLLPFHVWHQARKRKRRRHKS